MRSVRVSVRAVVRRVLFSAIHDRTGYIIIAGVGSGERSYAFAERSTHSERERERGDLKSAVRYIQHICMLLIYVLVVKMFA